MNQPADDREDTTPAAQPPVTLTVVGSAGLPACYLDSHGKPLIEVARPTYSVSALHPEPNSATPALTLTLTVGEFPATTLGRE